MTILDVVEPLIPVVFGLISEARAAAKEKNDEKTEVAVGILMGILGTSHENKTRIAMALARAAALEEFGPLPEKP